MKKNRREFLKLVMAAPIVGISASSLKAAQKQQKISNMPTPDAVDNRRLIWRMERDITTYLREFLFCSNDARTRRTIHFGISDYLVKFAHKNRIQREYHVICDETNNPPNVIDTNELAVDIFIRFPVIDKKVQIHVILSKTSTSFEELQKDNRGVYCRRTFGEVQHVYY